MRLSSLAVVAAVSCFVGTGLAQTGSAPVPDTSILPVHRIVASTGVIKQTGDKLRYIVRFKDAPVPLYSGGIAGLRATNPRVTGVRYLDVRSSRVRSYVSYLKSKHDAFLKQARTRLGRALMPHFQYHYALDGMSVSLTRKEAARLAQMTNVLSVSPVRYYRPQTSVPVPATASYTSASRAWINAPDVWSIGTFDTGIGSDTEGEGVVVADVDTGINSGNSSFAASGPDGYAVTDPLGSGKYLGVCDSNNANDGTLADATDYPQTYQSGFHCNPKLIGAYTYTFATGNDPNSPEDSEGHGSHTASTMVGNFVDVNLSTLGITVPISGVAPHANIIAYDVCDPTDFCGSDTSVAAVDQAIKDQSTLKAADPTGFKGMVLNYSIDGGEDPYDDPVELAFLSAVEAGIYVSAAGGNGGPGNTSLGDPTQLYPVEHVSPWVASIAASTHDGVFQDNDLTGFNGGDDTTRGALSTTISGEGTTGPLSSSPIVYAGDGSYDYSPYPGTFSTSDVYTLSGENYADPSKFTAAQATAECLYPFNSGTFPPGSIVVCDRGDIPLVDKADNVKSGDAGGIVIVSQSGTALISEPYEIPGTMIANSDGLLLEAWLTNTTTTSDKGTGSAARAQITGTTLTSDPSQADQIAGFSSRGPTDSSFDDLIKPDLTAPGVSVLAAVANPLYVDGGADQPDTYDFYDGTSMATPHDTGAGALLMQLHPDWSPAEIRSALMLTAVTSSLIDQCESLDGDDNCIPGTSVPSPQVRGAGRIDVDAASRTGIVLDETVTDYKAADPAQGGDLTKLNLAGLANGDCVTTCTWKRTLTGALTATTATYTASVSDPDTGLDVTVSPASFSLAPGATEVITVTANVEGAPYRKWLFAQLDIKSTDKGDDGQPIPDMHMPMAVEPQQAEPVMSVSPASLSLSVVQKKTVTGTFKISNTGVIDLDWALSHSSASPSGILWDQPDAGSGQGYPTSLYIGRLGVYLSDHLVMPLNGSISKISADGFAQISSGPADLGTATAIDWYIYASSGIKPAGDPGNGIDNYEWHYTAAPGDAGVDTAGGTITLDLKAAGQAAISLPAGTYWLIVVPTFNDSFNNQNHPEWYWLEGTSADGQNHAVGIDRSDATGGGWQVLNNSLAFTVTGELNCSSSITGLSFSETQGVIKAAASTSVTASFDAANADVGSYTTGLCVTGNDPVHPMIALPLSVTVSAISSGSSSGGGGGGGGLDLIGLLVLGLLGWRRLRP